MCFQYIVFDKERKEGFGLWKSLFKGDLVINEVISWEFYSNFNKNKYFINIYSTFNEQN